MTTYAIPDWHRKYVTDLELDLLDNVKENRSKLNLAVQTVEFPGDSWVIGLEYRSMPLNEFWAVRAFWLAIRRAAHRVRVWVMDHEVPVGTMRGAPVLTALHGEGANQIGIQTTAGATLAGGDFIGVTLSNGYQQLFLVHGSTTVGSVITVSVTPPMRRSANGGSVVTWNKPYLDCLIAEKPNFHSRGNMGEGFTVMMIEVPMR